MAKTAIAQAIITGRVTDVGWGCPTNGLLRLILDDYATEVRLLQLPPADSTMQGVITINGVDADPADLREYLWNTPCFATLTPDPKTYGIFLRGEFTTIPETKSPVPS